MRINKFVALATGMSRRAADSVIESGRVKVNGRAATAGQDISDKDKVTIDNTIITANVQITTLVLHKPVGYVCSRDGQGSKTIYELIPSEYAHLKPIGRLDKNSSGLLLMTNDGQLAQQLTHPSYGKSKVYQVSLDKPLTAVDAKSIQRGVMLEDGKSALQLKGSGKLWAVTMSEGRNRQIRRTFEALGYGVIALHRTQFGQYELANLRTGNYQEIIV